MLTFFFLPSSFFTLLYSKVKEEGGGKSEDLLNRLILISLMVKLDTSNILILVRIFDKNLIVYFRKDSFMKLYN